MVRCFTCEEARIACEEKNLLHWLPPNLRACPLQIGLETYCPCPILNRRSAYLTTVIYNSHSLENLARVISCNGAYNPIDLVFRPPYKGRYGAIIERLFRNLSGQIKEL